MKNSRPTRHGPDIRRLLALCLARYGTSAFGHDGVGKVGAETRINSSDLSGILMLAVQALKTQNEELKARLEALERAGSN